MNSQLGHLGGLVLATLLVLALIVALRLGSRVSSPPEPASSGTAEPSTVSRSAPMAADSPPAAPYLVTVFAADEAPALDVFLELYEGPEPGDWIATSDEAGGGEVLARVAVPALKGRTYLVRIDSRTGAMGPYDVAFHRVGQSLDSKERAELPDRYEPDDSWFQATRLVLGESQSHSLSVTANPRGDEDWLVFVTH